ncbi:DUF167 domain-containing protein [Candidatus Pyrohabitans sp.]
MEIAEAIRGENGETLIDIIVSPNARKDELADYDAWRRRIVVRVAARPRGGEANRALLSFFASLFGVSKGDVNIVKGDSSKQKTIRVHLPRDRVLEAISREL